MPSGAETHIYPPLYLFDAHHPRISVCSRNLAELDAEDGQAISPQNGIGTDSTAHRHPLGQPPQHPMLDTCYC